MNYYYCIPCNKRIELKFNGSHLKSQEHMNNEGRVVNNYTFVKPQFCEINSIIKNNVNNYNRRFRYYEMQCKWKLVHDNDIPIDVNSKSQYRRSLSHSFEKHLKNKINHYEKRGLKISHISEMNFTFTTYLRNMTHRHYLENPMPMVERLINRNLYKKYDLMKSLDGIDSLLQKRPHETGEANQ